MACGRCRDRCGCGYGGQRFGCGCLGACTCGGAGRTLVIQQPLVYAPKHAPGASTYPPPASAYPPRPLTIFGFWGQLADVTLRARQLAAAGQPLLAANPTFACDPSPSHPKGLCVIYAAGGGAHAQAGAPGGSALVLPPGTHVTLALYGAFADVSRPLQALARPPEFEVAVAAGALGGADPTPGAQKTLFVLVGGGARGELLVVEREGGVARIAYA